MQLSEKAKKARREYRKRWREQNRDKVIKSQNRFYEKMAQEFEQEQLSKNA